LRKRGESYGEKVDENRGSDDRRWKVGRCGLIRVSHSRTFTIIDIEDGEVKNIEVLENPAKNMVHGRGPIVGKSLADRGVDIVITGKIGPGASTVLEQLGIKVIVTNPGQKVEDVLRKYKLMK